MFALMALEFQIFWVYRIGLLKLKLSAFGAVPGCCGLGGVSENPCHLARIGA